MFVYKITNIVNNKIYIGITTTSMKARINSYKSAANSIKKNRHRMVLAMKKYGFENFQFQVIFETNSKEELKKKEIEFISLFDSTDPLIGYNISLGGDLPSEEVKEKISLSLHGRNLSEEHKTKISNSLMGHSVSDKIRKNAKAQVDKIAGWNKGTKGIMKSNSGSFSSDKPAPNKGRKRIIDEAGNIRFIKVTQ